MFIKFLSSQGSVLMAWKLILLRDRSVLVFVEDELLSLVLAIGVLIHF